MTDHDRLIDFGDAVRVEVVNTSTALLWVNGLAVPPGGTTQVTAYRDGRGRYVFSAELMREDATNE
jgi:hypothetical protein